ncbi:MAG: coproporphyrinogen dehydrogenase HemZ [Oscillospiraceae bacterium]|jgi:oxygen-independent coproporphyrinogen-3 oxidase|nr:coproporphyrinogen dehydrogenase HemZ [Oscillospiraceae bacterium]
MRLRLSGHGYRYAVEQIMLAMFPGELPDYTESGFESCEEPSACVRIGYGEAYATASTVLRTGGGVYRGRARVGRAALTDAPERDRLLQSAIKRSFYKAAVAAVGAKPVWGSLTGIRPARVVAGMLKRGASERGAERSLREVYGVSPERAALCMDAARQAAAVGSGLPERAVMLYIGIPFCPSRCAYCSFVSHSVEKSAGLIGPFLGALRTELAATAELARALGLTAVAVYVGGGTPTTLTARQLDDLLGDAVSLFSLSEAREFTVEAGRPDTITPEKLAVMQKRGVTRVSVNPQSMSDAVLDAIGRRHTADDTVRAYEDARAAGFENINMDVIAGLPSDTPSGFAATVERILALRPENVTVHTLSLKKGSRITLDGTSVPDGGAVSDMLGGAAAALRTAGYSPYYLYRQKFTSGGFENTGWSLPGSAGIYNVCMMEELRTVLACGGGGVTKLVDAATGRIERIFNPKYPYEYVDRIERIIEKKTKIEVFFHGI